ncbi:MAG TPA: TIGR01777 family oxidoreductase [Bacillus sp. (in: firmicutes)]|uniref:TIGR01777 family oxidoreductase n=1 Tax=Bacillus litorisediminis TaxID=2922713 RepID=UPI001FAC67E6|nr:TIGR01777 family oxidoreductase [Bacillus litorisediminis]HWO74667.1 TIGR01777 family oxidoreductase [Bacillus sp. (in: firmicutes)]
MKIAIAGGSGFVGKALGDLCLQKGYEVTVLTRSESRTSDHPRLSYIQWLSPNTEPETHLEGFNAFINLSGESLNSGRWTRKRKKQIVDSRISTTKELKRIVSALEKKPDVVVQASAIGIYGTSTDQTFTEDSAEYGSDFLAETVKAWEKEAEALNEIGIRTCLARFGVILEKDGGALPLMALPYKLFAGGRLGRGDQWVSWVHLEDVVRSILYLIHNPTLQGPINITAPNPTQMNDFGKTLGRVLNRPHWFPTPGFALRPALGEKSMLVLKGQKVLPEKLKHAGFTFQYPDVDQALQQIFSK